MAHCATVDGGGKDGCAEDESMVRCLVPGEIDYCSSTGNPPEHCRHSVLSRSLHAHGGMMHCKYGMVPTISIRGLTTVVYFFLHNAYTL